MFIRYDSMMLNPCPHKMATHFRLEAVYDRKKIGSFETLIINDT